MHNINIIVIMFICIFVIVIRNIHVSTVATIAAICEPHVTLEWSAHIHTHAGASACSQILFMG